MSPQYQSRRRYIALVAFSTASVLLAGASILTAAGLLGSKALVNGGIYWPSAAMLIAYVAASVWVIKGLWAHASAALSGSARVRDDAFDPEVVFIAFGCLVAGAIGLSHQAPIVSSAAALLAGSGALVMLHTNIKCWSPN